MALFGKSRRTANIVIDDYIIRMVENNGKDLLSLKIAAEKPLPQHIIENGRIVDEPAFYEVMKEAVREWGIRQRNVRFFAPQSLVILREIDIPEDVGKDDQDLKGYINLEIGNTIHFPFKNPIFDIYPRKAASNKVTVLAAPENELLKYAEIFSDVSLKPDAVEIQALGIYRYFLHTHGASAEDYAYMIIEYNIGAVNISIFHEHRVEFLRHQPLNVSKQYWKWDAETRKFQFDGDDVRYQGEIQDQLNEFDRIMNFYRFSLHHGNKEVKELIVTGDSPHIHNIGERIGQRYPLPVKLLDVTEQLNGETLPRAFIPALGLALRGGK